MILQSCGHDSLETWPSSLEPSLVVDAVAEHDNGQNRRHGNGKTMHTIVTMETKIEVAAGKNWW